MQIKLLSFSTLFKTFNNYIEYFIIKNITKLTVDTETPYVSFPLIFLQFFNDGIVKYKASGKWLELPSEGIELLENSYRIRSYDTNGKLNFDQNMNVSGCSFSYNNLNVGSSESTQTNIYPQPANNHIFTPMISQTPDQILLYDLNSNTYPISETDFSMENNILKLNLDALNLNTGIYILQWSINNQSFSESFMIEN